MSDSVRPHRWKPTRLPHRWDSPGKNTGVGCHFLLQCMKVKSEREVARVRLSATPWTIAYQAPPSMGFSRQEYWSGVPLPSPRLCLRGAEKPLKHSEQRISDGTCISERSCSISCENLNQEGRSGNHQGGCLDETK